MSITLKFEKDPISGCWDIPLLIFWGCLPMEVVFVLSIFLFWFGALLILVWSTELKFQISERSDQWLLRYSTFNILRSSSIGGRLCIFILVWSSKLKFKIWGKSEQWLLRYSTLNILRSSSIGGRLCFKHFYFVLAPLA